MQIIKTIKQRIVLYLSIIISILSFWSCDKQLDIQTDFPFQLQIMPVPDHIEKEQTVEIKCHIRKDGNYTGVKYSIRYFQNDGDGGLMFPFGKPFTPNEYYTIPEETFTLYYKSASKDKHKFQIWISDNFGNEQMAEFSFN